MGLAGCMKGEGLVHVPQIAKSNLDLRLERDTSKSEIGYDGERQREKIRGSEDQGSGIRD